MGKMFHLECDFGLPASSRLPYIKWKDTYTPEADGSSLRLRIKPEPDYKGTVTVTLVRNS